MKITIPILKKQKLLLSLPKPYILFGGSRGGGKTYGITLLALQLINQYPGARICIVRKNLPRLKDTTLKTFLQVEQKYPEVYRGRFNAQSFEYRHPNGSEILFRSADPAKDPEFQQFRGLELSAFMIDEASEVIERVFDELDSTLRLRLKNGTIPPYYGICTSNPCQTWVKHRFIEKNVGAGENPDDYLFIPALPGDNFLLPNSYIEKLKKLPEKLRRLYYEGDWSVQDEIDALMKYDWFVLADRTLHVPGIKKLGVDVARFGKDKTVIILIDGNTILKVYAYDKTATTDVVKKIKMLIRVHQIDHQNVGIDEVGVGGGVVDQLKEGGYKKIKGINSGRKATKKDNLYTFANLKAQMYWELRNGFEQGKLKVSLEEKELIDDLLAIKWEIRNDKIIKIEGKEEMKKRINRSPDYADALALAYSVDQIRNIGKGTATIIG